MGCSSNGSTVPAEDESSEARSNVSQRHNVPRRDSTIGVALGCAAAIALVVVVILIVYLWTL
jgi:hypothetical protein